MVWKIYSDYVFNLTDAFMFESDTPLANSRSHSLNLGGVQKGKNFILYFCVITYILFTLLKSF